MKVIVFELAGGRYAFEMERVGRILAPPGRHDPSPGLVDLGRLLELSPLPPLWDARQGNRIRFANGEATVRVGRPLGTAVVRPEWILPLPGYIFKARHELFRGLIEPPMEEADAAPEFTRLSLLLSHDFLAAEASG